MEIIEYKRCKPRDTHQYLTWAIDPGIDGAKHPPAKRGVELVDEVTSGGGLARVNMTNNHNVDVKLLLTHAELLAQKAEETNPKETKRKDQAKFLWNIYALSKQVLDKIHKIVSQTQGHNQENKSIHSMHNMLKKANN